MKRRPWPIVILAICQFIAPLVNVLLNAYLFQLTPAKYLKLFVNTHSWVELFHLFVLFPIAGYAIYACRWWSLGLFLAIEAWTIVWNVHQVQTYPEVFSYGMLLSTYVVNIALVCYFLIPAVRAVYSNPRLRWWETAPRYEVNLSVNLFGDWGNHVGQLVNISTGGVLLRSARKLELNESGSLQLSLQGMDFAVRGRVVHSQGRSKLFGIQFVDVGEETQANLKRLLKALALLGNQNRDQDRKSSWSDLGDWAKEVFTTGKGMVPQIPQGFLEKSQPLVSPAEQISVDIAPELTLPDGQSLKNEEANTPPQDETELNLKAPTKPSRLKRKKVRGRKRKLQKSA